jgi:spore germination cell wall hydrolase CwlJ-like protein
MFMSVGLASYPADTFTLTYTIYREACGEPLLGKKAVASVIYNRAVKSGKSFEYECLKYKQFSCWNGIVNKKRPPLKLNNSLDVKAWDESYAIAILMVNGVFKPIGVWNHYYNPSKCSPSWGDKMTHVDYIGDHKFGKL